MVGVHSSEQPGTGHLPLGNAHVFFWALAGCACVVLALFLVAAHFNPKTLRDVQLFQVLRAQLLKPYYDIYEHDESGNKVLKVAPRFTNQLGNNLFQYALCPT